ncbi:MAG: DNA-binding protein WhiA [Lachnospiraceae bacterium]|nr:DNA-binding protein WhiA [Lachnospiraceae bacterium]
MSFAADVKEELIARMPSAAHCRKAELCGYFVYRGTILPDGSTEFITEQDAIAKKVFTFLKKSFNIGLVSVKRKAEGHSRTEYVVRVPDPEEAAVLLKGLSLGENFQREGKLTILSEDIFSQSCCKRSFLRAAFCMGGTMNDPKKSYHFEIAVPDEPVGKVIAGHMSSFGCVPKWTERRGNPCLYLKDGNGIADMLNVMEAHGSLLTYESERAVREVRGNINRKVNIEVANIEKAARASKKQIKDIELIRDTIGFGTLSEDLRNTAILRLNHPEASLGELGELSVPPLGRSGINHRLQKLCSIAEGLRSE